MFLLEPIGHHSPTLPDSGKQIIYQRKTKFGKSVEGGEPTLKFKSPNLKGETDKLLLDDESRYRYLVHDSFLYRINWEIKDLDYLKDELHKVSKLRKAGKLDQAIETAHIMFTDKIRHKNGSYEIDGNSFVRMLVNVSRIYQEAAENHEQTDQLKAKNLFRKALQVATFASDIDPNSARANMSTAILYRKINAPQESFPYAEQAVISDPNNSLTNETLARSYLEVGVPELALEHSLKAFQLDGFAPVKKRKASVYITLAETLIKLSISPGKICEYDMGSLYNLELLDREDDSSDKFNRAVEKVLSRGKSQLGPNEHESGRLKELIKDSPLLNPEGQLA